MKKEKLRKINKILIALFILIQPFTTIVRMVHGDIQLLGFSLFEMGNIFLIGISFLLTVFLYDDKKKFLKYIPYLFLLIIYIFAHYYNTTLFNHAIYKKQQVSFMVETYYILRTFLVPLILIFNIYYSGIKKRECINILQCFLFIVSFTIIFTNIFKIAFINYSEVATHNVYSIFDWFNFNNAGTYSYYQLTTKGLFLSGNQMSAILFMTFPLIVYLTYKRRSIFDYMLLVMQSISMFMLGTKTANVGSMLIYVTFILIWFFFYLLKKDLRSPKKIMIFTFIFYLLFPFSPVGYMMKKVNISKPGGNMLTNGEDNFDNPEEYIQIKKVIDRIEKMNCDELNVEEKTVVKNLLKERSQIFNISSYIVRSYNDLDHSIFWCHYLKDHSSNDYRVLKKSLLKEISDNNNNKLDRYLGMGYTTNFIYTEADYTYQYYLYGIFGILVLIGPYFIVLLYISFKVLKDMDKYFNMNTVIYLMMPSLALLIAYYSGHVLERSFPLIILAFVTSINLINIRDYDCKDKPRVVFISSTGGHLSELLQLKPMFEHCNYQLITEKTESTIGLKDKYGKRVHYLIFGTQKKLFIYLCKFTINCFKSLYYYIIYNPDFVISTGTHTAVPMCYIAKFFGSKIIFIETFANRNTKTKSGQMVYPIADKFIVQWEEMMDLYKDATYGGWIY